MITQKSKVKLIELAIPKNWSFLAAMQEGLDLVNAQKAEAVEVVAENGRYRITEKGIAFEAAPEEESN